MIRIISQETPESNGAPFPFFLHDPQVRLSSLWFAIRYIVNIRDPQGTNPTTYNEHSVATLNPFHLHTHCIIQCRLLWTLSVEDVCPSYMTFPIVPNDQHHLAVLMGVELARDHTCHWLARLLSWWRLGCRAVSMLCPPGEAAHQGWGLVALNWIWI